MHRRGLVREVAEQVFTLSGGQITPGFPPQSFADFCTHEGAFVKTSLSLPSQRLEYQRLVTVLLLILAVARAMGDLSAWLRKRFLLTAQG
jgi:hypothetical protein